MTDGERLALARPREIGELLGDGFRIYLRRFPVIFGIGLAVVAPVQLIVSGIGLEQITGSYREKLDMAEMVIPTGVSYFVIVPLIVAATIKVLQDLGEGERPHAGRAIQSALDVFPQLLLVVLLAGLGIALGLVLLVLPGVYIAVRWFFAPQTLVIDGKHGQDALRESLALTKGFWWRTFTVVLLANIVALAPAAIALLPFDALARSADLQAIYLGGAILTEALTAPFVAIVSTLLFFDIRARRAEVPAP